MKPEYFRFDLAASLLHKENLWVSSGYSSTSPGYSPTGDKVFGVQSFYAPPFACPDLSLNLEFLVNGHSIADKGSTNKNDVGWLYSEGWWEPGLLERRGTYHMQIDNKLISLQGTSKIWPMLKHAGFILEIEILNRSDEAEIVPRVDFIPGHPSVLPIGEWGFYPPGKGDPADRYNQTRWINKSVVLQLNQDTKQQTLAKNESATFYIAVQLFSRNENISSLGNLAEEIKTIDQQRHQRVARLAEAIPVIESENKELNQYYNRCIATAITCTMEHPDFVLDPFPVESGIDGGGACAYPWGVGGYVPTMTTLTLGETSSQLLSLLVGSDLDHFYALTLNGGGVGISYAYDHFALTSLAEKVFGYHGFDIEIFKRLKKRLLSDYEKRPKIKGLVDAGIQENLLEMRTCSWQHCAASPNIEWARNFEIIAEMSEYFDKNDEAESFRSKANEIRKNVTEQLWDAERKTFRTLFPDGHVEYVDSIQFYDAYRCGIPEEIEDTLLSRLTNDDFLGDYGVHSVSRKDMIHFERNDPDWSGGGAYTGEAPQLATILWENGKSDLAWNILTRLFWMGKHLPYFPQEHYCDKPGYPTHKRSACVAGSGGAEAIISGLFGIEPQYDGSIWIKPNTPPFPIALKNIKIQNRIFTIELKKDAMRILEESKVHFDGGIQPYLIKSQKD